MPEESRHSQAKRSRGRASTTAPRLDARDPYVVNTHELGRRAGAMAKIVRTVPAPTDLGGVSGGMRVPDDAELSLEFRLESVMEGVLVTGTVRGPLVGECGRCLDPVEAEVEAEYQELFSYPDDAVFAAGSGGTGSEPGADDADEDVMWLVGDFIDLRPMVHDAVVLALPLTSLCRDDCPGLCAECGAHLADDPDHRHEQTDPRWEALRGLGLDQPVEPTGSRDQAGDEANRRGAPRRDAHVENDNDQES